MRNLRSFLALFSCCVMLSASAVTVQIIKYQDAACGQALGAMEAYITGGAPPYSIQWSNGSTSYYVEFLPPGTYSVIVIDALSDTVTASETILTTSAHPYTMANQSYMSHCPGEEPYGILYLDGGYHGPAPHQITVGGLTNAGYFQDAQSQYSYHYLWFGGSTPGSVINVSWTDASGCPGTSDVVISNELVWPTVQVQNVQGACNGNNGSISGSINNPIMQAVDVVIRNFNGLPPNFNDQVNLQNSGTQNFNFTNLPAGGYWIITDPDVLDAVPYYGPNYPMACGDSLYVVVPDLSGACGTVSGTVYLDHDMDCTQDVGDVGAPFNVIEILPGPHYALSSGNGHYSYNLPSGSYTLDVQGTGTDLYPVCPTTQPVPFNISGGNVVLNIADSSLVPTDLEARIGAGAARPGFVHNVWMRTSNNSGQLSGTVDATFTFDAQMTFISANPTPTSVVGSTVTWSGLPAMGSYADTTFWVQLQVPPDPGLIGLPFSHSFSVDQSLAETNTLDNTDAFSSLFTGSFDPNDKSVRTSSGQSATQFFISDDEYMDYTIRFQNTGNDTAFTITVVDTLDTDLDLSTFEQGVASHAFSVQFTPERTVKWVFSNILLPDSNTNEPLSHGQVSFRIKPLQPWVAGTVISNNADIYFDFNPPVRTNDAVVVLETSTLLAAGSGRGQGLSVSPNPGAAQVQVSSNSGMIDRVRIVSIDGRSMKNTAVHDRSVSLDVTDMPAGAFVIVASMTDGSQLRSTFVKY